MGTSRKTDVILGNPPWGSVYSQEEKEYFRKAFRTAGIKTAESGDMFVEQSLKSLPEGGRICFVLPEALLHVKTHRIVRALILEQCTVVHAEYLGEVFDKVQCPSVILSLEKRETSVTDKGKGELTRLSEEGFLLDITENEFALLQKLSGMEDAVTLKGQAAFALGIVTGNNTKYLTEHKEEGSEPILRGTDIERFKVKEAASYICFAPDRYQQVAPEELYRAKEKLLYRFVGEKPVFAYDDKRTLTLNSCNIVIPKVAGMDMRYIMAVFNSNVIEFWHKCRNHSMKMLRSHIEAFPIPKATRAEQEEIVGWVKVIQENEQEIQKLQEQNGKEPCEMIINELLVTNEKLCRKLNWKIAQLFGLTDEEYEQMIGCINRRRMYE